MLHTTACILAAETHNQHFATLWFLVLFTLFISVDSVVNAVGDTAKAGKSNFIDNIITTLEDQEL